MRSVRPSRGLPTEVLVSASQIRMVLSLHLEVMCGGEGGLILMVLCFALMNDYTFQVVTNFRTDVAGERLPVGMVKKCRKDCHAFDSQRIGFKRTSMSNDGLLPSVKVLVFAQPPPILRRG